jgi:hypothetical protein
MNEKDEREGGEIKRAKEGGESKERGAMLR